MVCISHNPKELLIKETISNKISSRSNIITMELYHKTDNSSSCNILNNMSMWTNMVKKNSSMKMECRSNLLRKSKTLLMQFQASNMKKKRKVLKKMRPNHKPMTHVQFVWMTFRQVKW